MRATNFLLIVLIAAALAAYSAWAESERVVRSSPTGIPLVHRAEAEALWHEPTTLFLDVRPMTDYWVGHIKAAVALPYEEMDRRLPELKPRLERARTLVVYCKSVDCGKSLWAAIELRNAGLSNVVIYPNGWHDWVDAGLPAFKAER